MPLLPFSCFESVFSRFSGKKIGFIQMDGNVGDQLINLATTKLFIRFQINYSLVSELELKEPTSLSQYDELVISGGGNMGSKYPICQEQRKFALKSGLPITILPQSFTDSHEDISGFKRVYVRENASFKLCKKYDNVVYAPDLALGLSDQYIMQPTLFSQGLFLREDMESTFMDTSQSIADPAKFLVTPWQYLSFASMFEEIITDRLHFAIAGLIMGRKVTLLPNSYFKNESMFITSLRQFGCHWENSIPKIQFNTMDIREQLWRRIGLDVENRLPWNTTVLHADNVYNEISENKLILRNKHTGSSARLDASAKMIWDAIGNSCSLNSIVEDISKMYPNNKKEIANDVQATVGSLSKAKLVSCNTPPIRVKVEEDKVIDGWLYRAAIIDMPWTIEERIWFALPEQYESSISKTADCFVVSLLMIAMQMKLDICVVNKGISEGLLSNLTKFQKVWAEWRTDLSTISIDANQVHSNDRKDQALLAFSGGLDSSFTLHRLDQEIILGSSYPEIKALMVHGFDIPLCDVRGFNAAFDKAKRICDDIGTELIPMRSNAREIATDWNFHHGPVIAGALHVLSSDFGTGVISNTLPKQMDGLLGSHRDSDPLMSAKSFEIVHYGDEYTRLEKFQSLANRGIAIDNLRVCWQSEDRGKNCGHCTKCVLTQMTLRLIRLPLHCFEYPLSESELAERLPIIPVGHLETADLKDLANYAKEFSGPNLKASAWVLRLIECYEG